MRPRPHREKFLHLSPKPSRIFRLRSLVRHRLLLHAQHSFVKNAHLVSEPELTTNHPELIVTIVVVITFIIIFVLLKSFFFIHCY